MGPTSQSVWLGCRAARRRARPPTRERGTVGFLDKFTGSGRGTDYVATLTAHLGGDVVRAATQAIPSAYKRGGSGSLSVTNRLLSKAVNVVENKVSGDRHVGGADNGIARTLPRDGSLCVIAFSDQAFTIWDFGMYGIDPSPDLLVSVPRSDVRSLVDTGTTAQGGVPVARLTFTDGSFFDYRLVSKPGPEFWAAVPSA